MSDPQPYGHAEWQERLQRAVEATLRKRRARRAFQDDHKRRRDVGLTQRHAEKLARADQRLRQANTDPDDSWREDQ